MTSQKRKRDNIFISKQKLRRTTAGDISMIQNIIPQNNNDVEDISKIDIFVDKNLATLFFFDMVHDFCDGSFLSKNLKIDLEFLLSIFGAMFGDDYKQYITAHVNLVLDKTSKYDIETNIEYNKNEKFNKKNIAVLDYTKISPQTFMKRAKDICYKICNFNDRYFLTFPLKEYREDGVLTKLTVGNTLDQLNYDGNMLTNGQEADWEVLKSGTYYKNDLISPIYIIEDSIQSSKQVSFLYSEIINTINLRDNEKKIISIKTLAGTYDESEKTLIQTSNDKLEEKEDDFVYHVLKPLKESITFDFYKNGNVKLFETNMIATEFPDGVVKCLKSLYNCVNKDNFIDELDKVIVNFDKEILNNFDDFYYSKVASVEKNKQKSSYKEPEIISNNISGIICRLLSYESQKLPKKYVNFYRILNKKIGKNLRSDIIFDKELEKEFKSIITEITTIDIYKNAVTASNNGYLSTNTSDIGYRAYKLSSKIVNRKFNSGKINVYNKSVLTIVINFFIFELKNVDSILDSTINNKEENKITGLRYVCGSIKIPTKINPSVLSVSKDLFNKLREISKKQVESFDSLTSRSSNNDSIAQTNKGIMSTIINESNKLSKSNKFTKDNLKSLFLILFQKTIGDFSQIALSKYLVKEVYNKNDLGKIVKNKPPIWTLSFDSMMTLISLYHGANVIRQNISEGQNNRGYVSYGFSNYKAMNKAMKAMNKAMNKAYNNYDERIGISIFEGWDNYESDIVTTNYKEDFSDTYPSIQDFNRYKETFNL